MSVFSLFVSNTVKMVSSSYEVFVWWRQVCFRIRILLFCISCGCYSLSTSNACNLMGSNCFLLSAQDCKVYVLLVFSVSFPSSNWTSCCMMHKLLLKYKIVRDMFIVHPWWNFYRGSSSMVIWSEFLQHGCHSHLQEVWKGETRELQAGQSHHSHWEFLKDFPDTCHN